MKVKRIFLSILTSSLLMVGGCSSDKLTVKETREIEYGTEYKVEEVFKASKKDTKVETNITVDTHVIGKYEVQIKASNDEKKLEEKKKVMVKDTKEPDVTLVQDKEKVFEIPLNGEFNAMGNIEDSQDEVDGAIKTIQVCNGEEFASLQKAVEENKKKLEGRIFKSEEEIKMAKESTKDKNMYIAVTSDIDVTKEGEYEIKVMSVDSNFTHSNVNYKVKVLAADATVQEGMLAAGVKDGPVGTLAKENINLIQQAANEAAIAQEAQTNGVKSIGDKVEVKQYKTPSEITSTNTIVSAAKARVGQSLWCDELVSAALIDAGKIEGGASGIVGGVIGVYYFPKLGKFISQPQAVPGDLVYYDDGGLGVPHIAVYAGNGIAIHGGFSGGKVVIYSVNIGTGPKYLRIPDSLSSDQINTAMFGEAFAKPNKPQATPPVTTPEITPPTPPPPTTIPDNNTAEVTNTYSATYNDETVKVSGKNIEHGVMEEIVWQYFEGTIDKATMESKLKELGCTVTY